MEDNCKNFLDRIVNMAVEGQGLLAKMKNEDSDSCIHFLDKLTTLRIDLIKTIPYMKNNQNRILSYMMDQLNRVYFDVREEYRLILNYEADPVKVK